MSIGSVVAGAGRAIGRGYNQWLDDAAQVGPDIPVTPFEPGQVSTGAAVLKLGASIAAARRRQANFDYAKQSREATLESDHTKTMAEIENLGARTEEARAQAEYLGRRNPEPEQYDVPITLDDGTKITVKLTGEQASKRGIALDTLRQLGKLRNSQANYFNRRPGSTGTNHSGDTAALNAARAVFADTDAQVKQQAERMADAQLAQERGTMTSTGRDMNDNQRAQRLRVTNKEFTKLRKDPKLRADWEGRRRAEMIQSFSAQLHRDSSIVARRTQAAKTIRSIARMDTTGTYDVWGPGGAQDNGAGDPGAALSDAIRSLSDHADPNK